MNLTTLAYLGYYWKETLVHQHGMIEILSKVTLKSQTDTVLNLVLSPEAKGGQIHSML